MLRSVRGTQDARMVVCPFVCERHMAARPLVQKTKERLQREVGAIRKPHANRLRVALAFPNTYYVGMSSLGFQTVYRLLNEWDEVVCERVFLPDEADRADLERSGQPLPSMESQTPVRAFDVIAFSLPFEMDYPNALRMLDFAGVEPVSQSGSEKPVRPLVIAGGTAATFNPEPMAPFIDAFLVGEAEDAIGDLIRVLLTGHPDRLSLLHSLAQVPGIYVPRFYTPQYGEDATFTGMKSAEGVPSRVTRRICSSSDSPAISQIITPETEFSNMVLAEVSRGCGRRCRFCVAGHIYLPPRPRDPQAILAGIRRVQEAVMPHVSEPLRAGLVSASLFDHPGSLEICGGLLKEDICFSISSTRADKLDTTILETLRSGGHETLTIAPEAGTERLRRALNKPMTDEALLRSIENAWDCGFRRLKLYFMVGLPTEVEADADAIGGLVSEIASRFKWGKLTVSLACFVPKPWTPFQWTAMLAQKELACRIASVRGSLRGVRSVSVTAESPREAIVQGVLARGDRRLEAALLAAARGTTGWRTAFSAGGVSPAFYAHRVREREEVFPWDHLDLGITRSVLWRGYEACCVPSDSTTVEPTTAG